MHQHGSRRGVLRVAVAAFVVVTQAPSLSLASAPNSPRDATAAEIAFARRLFDAARTAEDARDWSTAIAKLSEAISIKETAGLRFHLAYCEEQAGLLVEAVVDYERAEELSHAKTDEVATLARSRRDPLRKRIPTVTVIIPGDIADAELTIDGRSVAPTMIGKAISLNPGIRHIVVSAPSRDSFETKVDLAESSAVVATAVLPPRGHAPVGASPLPSSDPSQASTSPPGSSETRPFFKPKSYVLLGEAAITVAGLAVGITYAALGSSASDTISAFHERTDSKDPNRSYCLHATNASDCSVVMDAADERAQRRTISAIGFWSAGLGAAALTATWFLWRPKVGSATVGPIVSPQATGVSAAFRF